MKFHEYFICSGMPIPLAVAIEILYKLYYVYDGLAE